MQMGLNTWIKWSMLELRGLLEDEDAHVHFQRSKRHLGLHPFQLNDLNTALQEILSSKVNFYDSDLQGLVLAYKNPKLLSSLGSILHDSYFVHVDIEADFYIFRPKIGCTLKGIINKKAENHFGVLVHKAFNVSIPKPDECEEWVGDFVSIGQEVKFIITHLDFKGKLPFIRGQLIPDITIQAQRLDKRIDTEEGNANATIPASDNDVKTVNHIREKKQSKKLKFLDESTDLTESKTDECNIERSSNGKHEILDSEASSDERNKRKKRVSSSKKSTDGDDEKASRKKHMKDELSEDETDVHNKKASPKKHVKNESSGDETDVHIEKVSRKKRVTDESIGDETNVHDKKVRKKHVNDESSGDDTKAHDRKARKKRVKHESSGDETDVGGKKASRKKHVKDEPSEDETQKREIKVTIEKPDEATDMKVEKKLEADELIKREKSHKSKRKRTESESKSNVLDDNPEQQDETGKVNGQGENDDIVTSPMKRARKNRTLDSDTEDVSEIETKPDITAKKEKKKKKKQRVKEEDEEEEEIQKIVSVTPLDNSFEFVEPDLDAFITTSAKCKRKRRIKEDEGNTNDGSSSVKLVETKNEDEKEFFRDIRVKAEPDPSDCEDAVSRKKDRKRKKKLGKDQHDISFRGIEIKTEPDISDVEGTIPRKKKSKRRSFDPDSVTSVKIKVEPDASDVEDAATISATSLKAEPDESNI